LPKVALKKSFPTQPIAPVDTIVKQAATKEVLKAYTGDLSNDPIA
jgi:hypothetical protein